MKPSISISKLDDEFLIGCLENPRISVLCYYAVVSNIYNVSLLFSFWSNEKSKETLYIEFRSHVPEPENLVNMTEAVNGILATTTHRQPYLYFLEEYGLLAVPRLSHAGIRKQWELHQHWPRCTLQGLWLEMNSKIPKLKSFPSLKTIFNVFRQKCTPALFWSASPSRF